MENNMSTSKTSIITSTGQPMESVQQSKAGSLIEIIGRAASDPRVDIEKMRELLQIKRDIMADEARIEYATAMTTAQAGMSAVSQDAKNGQTTSKYATYAALDAALRPIYVKNGFSIDFDTADGAPDGYIRVICEVTHQKGHVKTKHLDMPCDGKGAKGGDVMTKTHATMAAVSYGRRGLLKMAFNISESDKDGNDTGDDKLIDQSQVEQIKALIDETGSDIAGFCKFMKVDALINIQLKDFGKAVQALNTKRKAGKSNGDH